MLASGEKKIKIREENPIKPKFSVSKIIINRLYIGRYT